MTAKPQISDGAGTGARVGVPLARAQRLAARSTTPQGKPRLPAILIGVAFTGLVAAGILAPRHISDPSVPADNLAAVADTALASSEFADLPPLAAPQPTSRARFVPCVGRIENQLRVLAGPTASPDGGAEPSDQLSSLVQSTLDCREAGLEIQGSLELVTAGIADLRVRWDRDTSRLYLSVIDPREAAETQAAYAEDGLPVTFVVH